MKITHCFGPTESTRIRDHLVETLPRLIEQTDWNHEVIDTRRETGLEENIPNSVPVTSVDSQSSVGTLYERFQESDLLHLYSNNQTPLFRFPAHLANTPIIDHVFDDTRIPRSNRVERIICDNHVISEKQNSPRKTQVIPTGLTPRDDKPNFDRFEREQSLRLIEIRSTETPPDHSAEDYMTVLRQTSPEATCHVVGAQGEDVDGIQYHDRDQLNGLLSQCHFLINFSDDLSDNRLILEAYRAGVIPVSSGEAAVEETIKHTDTGFYLDSPNKGEVIKQLKLIANKFSDDSSFWIPMAKNGYQLFKDKFSRDQFLEHSTSLYRELHETDRTDVFPPTDWSDEFIQFFGDLVGTETKVDVTEVSHGQFPIDLERDLSRLLWSHRTWDEHPEKTLNWLSNLETEPIKAHYEVHLIRAGCHQMNERHEKSIAEVEEAIKREPDLPEPYFIGADCYLSSQDVEGALSLLKSFQERNPEYEPVNEMIKEIAPLRG